MATPEIVPGPNKILLASPETATAFGAARRRGGSQPLPRIGRWSDNELILFFEAWHESWIIYPPRSAYEFVERPSKDAAVVEFHSWAPMTVPDLHPVRPRDGCVLHGIECDARRAIQAAVDSGFDPFK